MIIFKLEVPTLVKNPFKVSATLNTCHAHQ